MTCVGGGEAVSSLGRDMLSHPEMCVKPWFRRSGTQLGRSASRVWAPHFTVEQTVVCLFST